jgi:three-Cys-motif partner protein
MPRRPDIPAPDDGLPARDSGPWSRTKLKFIDDFLPAALSVTHPIPHRHVVDLFAGPGKNVDRDTEKVFDGSPLRELRAKSTMRPPCSFTHATFVTHSLEHESALTKRIDTLYSTEQILLPRSRVKLHRGAAADLIPGIMNGIPRRAYVFAFADIENPSHWPWTAVDTLKRGHDSVDFYMLFPIDMGLVRLASYHKSDRDRWRDILTPFFGCEDWEEIAGRLRITDAQSPAFRRAIVDLYLSRLRTLWPHVLSVLGVVRVGDQTLYEMLFASKEPVAKKIVASVRSAMRVEQRRGQLELNVD